MEVVQLNKQHAEASKILFTSKNFMGVDHSTNHFLDDDADFLQLSYDSFADNYISGLESFKAFGVIEGDYVTSMITFYESSDNPEWYWTQIRSKNNTYIPDLLDKVIEYNESKGRLKFYSLFNKKYEKSMRRFAFSEYNNERYDSFDECIIPAKTKCYYSTPWALLFSRTMLPVDSIIRCSFLKQKYRIQIPIAGNL
jgi:superfamily I DNA and/or RNA helicase